MIGVNCVSQPSTGSTSLLNVTLPDNKRVAFIRKLWTKEWKLKIPTS